MFDWIPLEYYTNIYYLTMLLMVSALCVHTYVTNIGSRENVTFLQGSGIVTIVFIILYMGLRPISGRYFGDMGTYARIFENYAAGNPITSLKDPLFHSFTYLSAQIMNVHAYFVVCCMLYVVPLWFAVKRWFGNGSFYAFLLLVVSFSFWAYGTNGIRNGIAGSLFILAISRNKWLWKIILFIIAVNFHKTMLLPTVAYLLAYFYTKPKMYVYFWLACIPVSLLAGGVFQSIFASFMEDDRTGYLTDGNVNDDNFSNTGFRVDFLLYSASAVAMGYYTIFKKKYQDRTYHILFSVYLIANAFWILVIRANFSNRFAYLSWFMMALVIVYPMLKHYLMPAQNKVLAYIILAFFMFTFFMNFILA